MIFSWTKLFCKDRYSSALITEEVVEGLKRNSGRFRGSVRISQGRIFTDEEYDTWHKRIAKTPLP